MWSVKTMVITVIIGGNRYQLTIIRQYLNNMLEMYVIKKLQKKRGIFGTANIPWKVIM
jgi:hypothetical protein